MSITIYRRDGSVAFVAETAIDISGAAEAAVKDGANLDGANLYGANLSRATLSGATLDGATLSGATLDGANLSGATLSGATLDNPYRTTALAAVALTGGWAFKLVKADGGSPIQRDDRIFYAIGSAYDVADANVDPMVNCAPGINLATLPWCMAQWKSGDRIMVAEFKAADVAVVPLGTDGKFRVHRCRIVGELDLVQIGLVAAPVEAVVS